MPGAYLLQVFRKMGIGLGKNQQEYLASLVRELNSRSLDPNVPLAEQAYVAFDLETTGLHPFKGDRIIALGAVRVENGKITRKVFDRLVNPGCPIPHVVEELTGITTTAVAGAPNLEEVLPSFLAFLCQGVPLGFNTDFDLTFLNLALRFFGRLKVKRRVVLDALSVVRALNPRWEYLGLDEIAVYYGVPLESRHTALGDALIHARLFLQLVPTLEERGIYTWKDLRSYLHYYRRLY